MYKFTNTLLLPLVVILALLLSGCASTGGIGQLGKRVSDGIVGLASEAAAFGSSSTSTVDADTQARFDAAVLRLQSGELDKAGAEFEALAAAQPKLSGPHVNLALIHLQAGRLDAADAAASEAIRCNRASAPARNVHGIVLRQQGKFAEAEQAYRKALALDPDYLHAWRNLGVLYDLYLQQPHQAVEAYQYFQAHNSSPDKEVAMWISDLTRRFGDAPRSAQARNP